MCTRTAVPAMVPMLSDQDMKGLRGNGMVRLR